LRLFSCDVIFDMKKSCVSTICSRFRNQDVVGKEVTRLIHSDPVSFIDIPDAAQVCNYINTMWYT